MWRVWLEGLLDSLGSLGLLESSGSIHIDRQDLHVKIHAARCTVRETRFCACLLATAEKRLAISSIVMTQHFFHPLKHTPEVQACLRYQFECNVYACSHSGESCASTFGLRNLWTVMATLPLARSLLRTPSCSGSGHRTSSQRYLAMRYLVAVIIQGSR